MGKGTPLYGTLSVRDIIDFLVQIAANEDARFVIRTLVFDDQRKSRVPRVSRILAILFGNKNGVGISRGNFSEKKHPHIETFRYLELHEPI